jgi:two-component system chemotaxis response regulator CheY
MNPSSELNFLVADDYSSMRSLVRGLLEEMDGGLHHVEEAADGLTALNMLKQGQTRGRRYDFVVSDIHMPRMNGFELLQAIKSHDDLRHLPVLMLTTDPRREDIALARHEGAEDCLAKPGLRADLQAKVRQIMQARRLALAN